MLATTPSPDGLTVSVEVTPSLVELVVSVVVVVEVVSAIVVVEEASVIKLTPGVYGGKTS